MKLIHRSIYKNIIIYRFHSYKNKQIRPPCTLKSPRLYKRTEISLILISVPKNCSLQESQGGDVAPSTYQEAFRTHASSQGYKFSPPGRPTIKFSPPNVHQQQQQQVHNQLMQQSMHASPISYHPGSLSCVVSLVYFLCISFCLV